MEDKIIDSNFQLHVRWESLNNLQNFSKQGTTIELHTKQNIPFKTK